MSSATTPTAAFPPLRIRQRSLRLSRRASRVRRLLGWVGHGLLLLVTSSSALAVLFIFFFIANDAVHFFVGDGVSLVERVKMFFGSKSWYPTADPPIFGSLTMFIGSGLVTLGAVVVAAPLGVAAAVCLSDVLPFRVRQLVKPVIEVLAAIPSVAFGFFALVIFAPQLQQHGGPILAIGWWALTVPIAALLVFVLSDMLATPFAVGRGHGMVRFAIAVVLGGLVAWPVVGVGMHLLAIRVASGANALNVSVILGLMALPTIVSVSEDALQAVSRELREGAYALGSTRAEVLVRVVIPAASSGICAAVILGVMRAFGETMVVWMASGNAAQIPQPWYNFLQPVRTLTATIAGEMGEADQMTGSARYHVLFAMALVLLTSSFLCNFVSEQIVRRSAIKNR